MVEIKKYQLPPTSLIPNSPHPLLHYRGVLKESNIKLAAYDLFTSNEWGVQWVSRYGDTQRSHYHSGAHECMAVLSGSAIIRFGVADTAADMEKNTYGSGKEDGGIEVEAKPGDIFVIPAGVAHKTYETQPSEEFKILTPGEGHLVAEDARNIVENVELSGFTMIGAYPLGSQWDWAFGGDSDGKYEEVWKVPKPKLDPALGSNKDGLVGQWQ